MRYLLLLLLTVQAVPVWSACDAGDARAMHWLDRMSRSLREVSYQGVFTYEHGGSLQTLRISHSVEGGVESEYLTRLTGTGGSVLRTGHPLDCIHPGNRLLRIGAGFDNDGDDCGLAAHYQLKLGPRDLIAGRYAQILTVLPRDMYRYGYQMALDTETGLLLKSQTMAQDGKILERFQFAALDIGSAQVPGTQVDVLHYAQHSEHHPVVPPPEAASTEAWRVRWVPEGFTLTEGESHSRLDKTYTDGLAVFSVFLEPMQQQIQPGEGRARQGGTTAYTRGMQLGGKPILVTVVGEVPINTARMVADSLIWTGADAD
ncbi:MAG: MucB/RseB C-terminal domain-containing protein [Gammaproteobacteria bacterium]|nr:MucB/RseB C-terminal domain-containing protein [Gammaproteobacteria bacterium]